MSQRVDGQAASAADVTGAPAGYERQPRSPLSTMLAFGLGHGTADFYPGFLASILPYLMVKLGFSLTLAGGLASLETFATSLIQPLLGYVSDMRRPRPWAAWGIALAAILYSLLGLAPSTALVAFLIVAGGIGVALYHPQGASLATRVSRGKAGLAMSLFATGGSVGYALGPLLAVVIVERWGLPNLIYLCVPGLIVAVVIHRVMQQPLAEQAARPAATSLRNALKGAGSRLLWLLGTMTLRSAALSGISAMLPIYLIAKGMPEAAGGTALFIFRLAGGVGVFFGGPLSDRFGRKTVMIASFALTLPFIYLFFRSDGLARWGLLALASAILTSSTPVNTVMAQEATPKTAAIASGLMMGVGWSLGSLSVFVIGYLADRSSIVAVLPVAAVILILVGLMLSILLPEKRRAPAAAAAR
ncbi:MAG: MFS transporter [Anaerolineae bacterium]